MLTHISIPLSLLPTQQFALSIFYCGITSDVVFVGGVNLFYSSVAEGQLSHPVHSSSHAGCQTQVGTGGGGMEAVRTEVIRAKKKKKKEAKLVSDCSTVLKMPNLQIPPNIVDQP